MPMPSLFDLAYDRVGHPLDDADGQDAEREPTEQAAASSTTAMETSALVRQISLEQAKQLPGPEVLSLWTSFVRRARRLEFKRRQFEHLGHWLTLVSQGNREALLAQTCARV